MNILYSTKNKTLEIIKDDDVMKNIYYGEHVVPNIEQVEEYLKKGKDKKIKDYFTKNIADDIQKIKDTISHINFIVPLYNEVNKNMFLVPRTNLYKYVIYLSYRFPNEKLVAQFKKDNIALTQFVKNASDKQKEGIQYLIKVRQLNKMKLMLNFLENFNNKILFDTYIKTFYFYSDQVGGDITICVKPSFLPLFKHLNPYYTKKELINLGKNMELDMDISNSNIDKVCEIVKENDVSANIILDHQQYIINKNITGLIQYYSLQGSYFINKYLRNQTGHKYKNDFLEHNIRELWRNMDKTPAFDKSYILYRFINTDDHIKDMNIGDEYVDDGFISTTRDPFYSKDEVKFGFILIKIKVPANKSGVALCMESYSLFPEEQEVIFPPNTILKLIKKDKNALYYHPNKNYVAKIESRYEFVYVGKKDMLFIDRPLPRKIEEINFLKINKPSVRTLSEKINYFVANYIHDLYQIRVNIGGKNYTVVLEWFNSITAYERYYAIKTNNGFSLYTIIDGYFGFMIEIAEDNKNVYMYVNYYFKYSTVGNQHKIDDYDLINFISSVAHYFNIKDVIVYANYKSCDFDNVSDNSYHGGNYCMDHYEYIKNGKKRFSNIDSAVLNPQFSYYELDRLANVSPMKILQRDDQDVLYQLYDDSFKINTKNDNLKEFYLWIIKNHCTFARELNEKMTRFYTVNNPFVKDYYMLDANMYLYNNKLINGLYDDTYSSSSTRYQKNEYRIMNTDQRLGGVTII